MKIELDARFTNTMSAATWTNDGVRTSLYSMRGERDVVVSLSDAASGRPIVMGEVLDRPERFGTVPITSERDMMRYAMTYMGVAPERTAREMRGAK